jgi:hypothetical protein
LFSPGFGKKIALKVVRFEVFSAAAMKNAVLWDVTPCGSYENRRFGGNVSPPSSG